MMEDPAGWGSMGELDQQCGTLAAGAGAWANDPFHDDWQHWEPKEMAPSLPISKQLPE